MHSKSILITGATAGIGRAAALALAGDGHQVFATGRNEGALQKLKEEAKGLTLETIRLDVNDPESIEKAVRAVGEKTGGKGLDVLINNAGYGQAGAVMEVGDKEVRAQFETNVFGLLAVTRAFGKTMMDRGEGRIINISSGGGRISFPLMGVYCATKFAVESLSDALRMELTPFGVKVVLVEPGPIKTNFSGTATSTLSGMDAKASAYRTIMEKADEMQAQADRMSFHPRVVVRAIRKAATRRNPAARYMAPLFLTPLVYLSELSPTWIVDFVMRVGAGLTRRNLRQLPAAVQA